MVTTTPPRKSFWRRPWVAPMFVVMAAFLAFSLPPYLTGGSRVAIRENAPWHQPSLVGHIGFGTIALIACGFQVWPWFRAKYPAAHRRMGRIYVFAGVIPTALLGIVASLTSVVGMVGRIGNTTLCVVWLLVTYRGYKSARRRQFGDHRRWMIRSFALCTSIVVNRLWIGIMLGFLMPFLEPEYGGDMDALVLDAAGASIWLSWVVNLLIAEWWLDRGKGKARTKRGAPSRNEEVGAGVA